MTSSTYREATTPVASQSSFTRVRLDIAYLDLVRSAAALLVVLGHARLHAFGNIKSKDLAHDWLGHGIVLISNYAHPAVIIFFVVSGYLVGGKLINARGVGAEFAKSYAADRMSRIYTVSIPAITISYLLAVTLNQVLGQSFTLLSRTCEPSIFDLFGTTLFIHKGFWEGKACNGPFWSLIYEVFYYVWFATLALALWASNPQTRRKAWMMFFALGVYGAFEPQGKMLAYSSIWLFGACIAYKGTRQYVVLGAATAGIIAVMGLYAFVWHDDDPIRDVVVAILMAGSLLVVRALSRRGITVPVAIARIFAGTAAISYSTYLFHAPLLNAARTITEIGFGIPMGRTQPDGIAFISYFGLVSIGVLAGIAGWWCFERHTASIRVWLKGQFGLKEQQMAQ